MRKDNSVKKFIVTLVTVSVLGYFAKGLDGLTQFGFGALITLFFYLIFENYIDNQ